MRGMTFPSPRAVALALMLVAAPALAACGGSANAAHDACMVEATQQAASVDGADPADYEGDYDLMGLCDQLVGEYEDDGRVAHVVECAADEVARVGSSSGMDWDGSTPEKMASGYALATCL